ncbi:hypothetical protein FV139_10325 [Parahaliea maris]|uniref:Uncharacterized protein n=1 Tax=Parahaliea maris TaxID=2716870 RepID=A0A5C9A316_9GAMM|nr:hypothetical protein [Parahaliea maris]TXS94007.1 hypothetical protein FV139_10325 [Parahaliea maris]
MLRALKAYFPALILTYILAVVLATASVMDSLRDMGVAVSATVQVQATWHDLLGMTSTYLVLLAVALLVAFVVAAGVIRLVGGGRLLWYSLAGAVAVLVLHITLQLVLHISPVAAARSAMGLAGQCLAGAVGGWFFALLTAPPADRPG